MRCQDGAYLQDHCVLEEIIFPGAGYCEIFASGLQALIHHQGGYSVIKLHAITFEKLLRLSSEKPTPFELIIKAQQNGEYHLAFFTYQAQEKTWHCHSRAKASVLDRGLLTTTLNWDEAITRPEPLEHDQFYQNMAAHGIGYATAFQVVKGIYKNNNTVYARLETEQSCQSYRVHPTILDGAFQTTMFLTQIEGTRSLFTRWDESLTILNPLGKTALIEASLREQTADHIINDITLYNEHGQCCILIKGFQAKRIAITHLHAQLHPQRDLSDFLYTLEWEPLLDVNGYRKKTAADFPALPALVKTLNAKSKTLFQGKDIVHYQEGFQYINVQAQEYMRQALLDLGVNNTLGTPIDIQAVKPAQQKLFSKILETLHAAGDLDDKNCLKQLLNPKLKIFQNG